MDTVVLIVSLIMGIVFVGILFGVGIMIHMNRIENKDVPKLPKKEKRQKTKPTIAEESEPKKEASNTEESEQAKKVSAELTPLRASADMKEEEPEKPIVEKATVIPDGKGRILLLKNSEWLLETNKGKFIHSASGKFVLPSNNILERRSVENLKLENGLRGRFKDLPMGSMFRTRIGLKGMKTTQGTFDLSTGQHFRLPKGRKTHVRQLLLRHN